ncbi:MAG: hypothetical protein ACXWBL_08320, partial [Usitatibacter sp.]
MQARIAAKGELRAAPREGRGEAQEEEHVAQPLLGEKREAAPGKIGRQARFARGARAGDPLRGEAPAVLR